MANERVKDAAIKYTQQNFETQYPSVIGCWIEKINETHVTHKVWLELNSNEFVTVLVRSKFEILDAVVED